MYVHRVKSMVLHPEDISVVVLVLCDVSTAVFFHRCLHQDPRSVTKRKGPFLSEGQMEDNAE